MSDFSRDEAVSTTWAASPIVRQVIMDEAREALRARHAMMLGLDQRISQAAAALFAAGAFAISLAFDIDAGLAPLPQLAGVASASFLVGAIHCIVGLRAGEFVFPGSSPSWWSGADFLGQKKDADRAALTWAAGNWEEAIASCDALARKRSAWFNLGLCYGVAGAAGTALVGVGLVFS